MKTQSWAEQVAQASSSAIARQVGAIPLLYPLLEGLQVRQLINGLTMSGAEIDLGRVVEVLTLNRLLAPRPLNHVGEWVGQSVVETMFGLDVSQLYDNRFGRALDNLQPILAEAWVELVSRVVSQEKIDLAVLHWDTTSIYLEGEYESRDLAAYGHSSDGRSDHKQVKIGLNVTSREQIPLLYGLLAGRRADITTPVPNLVRIAAFLERPECAAVTTRPLIVGDCKMITPAAVATAHRHKLYYLGPWESDNTVTRPSLAVSLSQNGSTASWTIVPNDTFQQTGLSFLIEGCGVPFRSNMRVSFMMTELWWFGPPAKNAWMSINANAISKGCSIAWLKSKSCSTPVATSAVSSPRTKSLWPNGVIRPKLWFRPI